MNDKRFTAGAIWEGYFDFNDGVPGRKKYVILLNDLIDSSDYFVVAFTTSNKERYGGETTKQCGCPDVPCYRLEKGQVACLPLTTWVQFDNTHPARPAELEAREKAGKLKYLLHLPEGLLRAVLNCAKKSDDLDGRLIGLVEKTLKKMDAAAKAAKDAKQPPPPPKVDLNQFPEKEVLAVTLIRAELDHRKIAVETFCAVLEVKTLDGLCAGDVRAALELLDG